MKSRRKRQIPSPLAPRASQHSNRDGSPKTAYRTETEAKSAAQLSWTLNRVDLNSYRCEICHQWHNGKDYRAD
jgi:hypothetical protein